MPMAVRETFNLEFLYSNSERKKTFLLSRKQNNECLLSFHKIVNICFIPFILPNEQNRKFDVIIAITITKLRIILLIPATRNHAWHLSTIHAVVSTCKLTDNT